MKKLLLIILLFLSFYVNAQVLCELVDMQRGQAFRFNTRNKIVNYADTSKKFWFIFRSLADDRYFIVGSESDTLFDIRYNYDITYTDPKNILVIKHE